jgi:predicted sugar kinase
VQALRAGLPAEAAVRRSGISGIRVEITSDFPLGAGLGVSYAAGVAVNAALNAWRGNTLDRAALAEQSRAIEVEDLGLYDLAESGGVVAIEWPDRLPRPIEGSRLIEITHGDGDTRTITIG